MLPSVLKIRRRNKILGGSSGKFKGKERRLIRGVSIPKMPTPLKVKATSLLMRTKMMKVQRNLCS